MLGEKTNKKKALLKQTLAFSLLLKSIGVCYCVSPKIRPHQKSPRMIFQEDIP